MTREELEKALTIFAEERLDSNEIKDLAIRYAPQFNLNNKVLAHKGINWYAKEILKANKVVPIDYSWRHVKSVIKRDLKLTDIQREEIEEAVKHEIVFDEECPEITEEKFKELKEKGLVWRNRYENRLCKKNRYTDKEN